jgi:hypothetical protein
MHGLDLWANVCFILESQFRGGRVMHYLRDRRVMTLRNGVASLMTRGGLDQGVGGDVCVDFSKKVMSY